MLWIVGAGVLIVALIGAVAVGLTRSDDDSAGDPSAIVETNAVQIDGTPLTELVNDNPALDPALGASAPTARGTGFDELSDHLSDVGLPDDVRIVAVSTSVRPDEGNFPPSAWFADERWPAPVLLDDRDGSLAQTYGLTGFPMWVVVDADGNVAARVSGAIGPDQFDALVDAARIGAPR